MRFCALMPRGALLGNTLTATCICLEGYTHRHTHTLLYRYRLFCTSDIPSIRFTSVHHSFPSNLSSLLHIIKLLFCTSDIPSIRFTSVHHSFPSNLSSLLHMNHIIIYIRRDIYAHNNYIISCAVILISFLSLCLHFIHPLLHYVKMQSFKFLFFDSTCISLSRILTPADIYCKN